MELGKPLDSLSYTFDVVNTGNIDAEIKSITIPTEETLNANDLNYSFTYLDTDSSGKEKETAIKIGDTLKANERRKLKLVVEYNDVDSLNQQNPVELSLDSSIVYGQL